MRLGLEHKNYNIFVKKRVSLSLKGQGPLLSAKYNPENKDFSD